MQFCGAKLFSARTHRFEATYLFSCAYKMQHTDSRKAPLVNCFIDLELHGFFVVVQTHTAEPLSFVRTRLTSESSHALAIPPR